MFLIREDVWFRNVQVVLLGTGWLKDMEKRGWRKVPRQMIGHDGEYGTTKQKNCGSDLYLFLKRSIRKTQKQSMLGSDG